MIGPNNHIYYADMLIIQETVERCNMLGKGFSANFENVCYQKRKSRRLEEYNPCIRLVVKVLPGDSSCDSEGENVSPFVAFLNHLFPDGLIYGLTVLVFLIGVFRCSRPVYRSAAALRHAARLLQEGAKAKLARPVWSDQDFLGKPLRGPWRAFLHSASVAGEHGQPCDVADFVEENAIIFLPGRAALADFIPGVCTSLGILGTFVGLYMGLTGLDVMNIESYTQLTEGISLAFMTSIVGLICSLLFNFINRLAVGRAQVAMDAFLSAFYAYAMPQPADQNTQLLTYQRKQAGAMSQFAEDMSVRMAGEINHAITSAMSPVQRSMEDFLNAATRAQVDGLDYIVARFIDRMNTALDGQVKRLKDALEQTADGQFKAQEDLRLAVNSIGQLTQNVVEVQGVSQQVIQKFAEYITQMEGSRQKLEETQAETVDLLAEINQSSTRQARYLSALQEYQAKLQASFQDYTVWTDKFVVGLEERTAAQNESLEMVTKEMRESSDLLRGAYKSFVESIELGLANALSLFDENMQNLTRQIHGTLSDIQETMVSLETALTRAANVATSDREVS